MIERIAILVILTIFSGASPAQAPNPQSGYSVETLSQPIFDTAEVAVETAAFNNWLNENYEKLTSDQQKGVREFLYYLIDSHVKDIYAREGQILPKEPDLILQILFAWSERLGVYGGSNVFNEIRLPSEPEMPSTLDPPDSISIRMHGDLLAVESKNGSWAFEIPYYFMPQIVSDLVATNGIPFQFLSIATGAARDSSEDGRSQATLMLIYSPDVDFTEFESYWLQTINVPVDAPATELGIHGLSTKYYYYPDTKIHTEVVVWEEGTGSFALTYAGVDGTYQWNRPHFLDFLNSLKKSQ